MSDTARRLDGASGQAALSTGGRLALRLTLSGHVQGVGFRPFVYRLARAHGLTGYVRNRLGQVEVTACGSGERLSAFRAELISRAPPLAAPVLLTCEPIEVEPGTCFEVSESTADGEARVYVPPDYFMCDDCRRELNDRSDRRFRYPFINCTQCGPRYTLVRRMPYDRPNTSMSGFPLCRPCEAEYRDPGDRRFHAEPLSCPDCGPVLSRERAGEGGAAIGERALALVVRDLADGAIVAVKGIGGYHLLCDACNADAVARLRLRKRRPDKPLAVMFPFAGADGVEVLRRYAWPSADEAACVASPARPIVLIRARPATGLAANIAPGLREIGAFLPYSPLHHLLLQDFGGPLVATSANVSGEPVLTDNRQASERLSKVATVFLHHDRPIVRPADDPVYRRIGGSLRPLRQGRGCAPVELTLPIPLDVPLLAVGGQSKNTIALGWGSRAVVSPHIGDMGSPRSLHILEQLAGDLQRLYGVTVERVACDAHRGYTTHRWARAGGLPVHPVWHHEAHAGALCAEVDPAASWLVFTWDGVGLGRDGTLWGGEALYGRCGDWVRVASFRRFNLPGGECAAREPWRSAAALCWTAGTEWPGDEDIHGIARHAWRHGLNCPQTSAAGRLFDAGSALITGCRRTSFEAQAPMMLEALYRGRGERVRMPLCRDEGGVWRSDWQPLLEVIADARLPKRGRAEAFHSSMATALLDQARRVREERSVDRVGLCGGVFQNRILAGEAMELLESHGFRVALPLILPCNDAALSFGQLAELAARPPDRRG